MANWDASANTEFRALKGTTHSTDAEMEGLKRQIDQWANAHPTGNTYIPFGKFNNHGVRVTTSGGWIKSVKYGDKV